MVKLDSEIIQLAGVVRRLNLVGGEDNSPIRTDEVSNEQTLNLSNEGVVSLDGRKDRHYGAVRRIRGYQAGSAWKSRMVRNDRQISLVVANDLLQIATDMDILPELEKRGLDVVSFMPVAVAANVVIDDYGSEIDVNCNLGPGTKLYIGITGVGAIIDIGENHIACSKPGAAIARSLSMDVSTTGKLFKKVAVSSRGYMAEVWASGTISVGDAVGVQLPVDFKGPNKAFWHTR